jgi:hypothetical protein
MCLPYRASVCTDDAQLELFPQEAQPEADIPFASNELLDGLCSGQIALSGGINGPSDL